MSKTSNQIVSVWEVVEDLLRRNYNTVLNSGLELSVLQVEILRDAISLTVLAWLDILSDFDGYSTRWVRPWLMKVMELDLHDLVDFLKAADELLLLSTLDEYAHICCYDDFKRHLRISYPFAGDLLGPLHKKLDRWLSNREVTSFANVHTAFVFITRLNLPELQSLEEKACASYLTGEAELQTSGFTTEERKFWLRWFPASSADFLYENWRPKHGPGICADISGKPSLARKYKNLRYDAMLHYLDLRLKPHFPRERTKKLVRDAKIVFVPKSIDKLRTICAEPTTLMWYQQGFLHSIMKYIDEPRVVPNTQGTVIVSHPLRRRVNLEDQSINRNLARIGSIDGSFATIDLTAASDSVSWPMIKQWARGSSLLPIFWATRSTNARFPDNLTTVVAGTKLKSEKFAPMGSALCFPAEIFTFCSIIEAGIQSEGGSSRDSDYHVHGDDIAIEAKYAEPVIRRLERNGFKVNTKKSFWKVGTHNYRESCGGEYLDGIDVTPSRLSRKFSGLKLSGDYDAPKIEALIKHCNDFYFSLPSVRRRILHELLQLPQEFRPLFSDADSHYPHYATAEKWAHNKPTKAKPSWDTTGGSVASFTATNHHLLGPFVDVDLRTRSFVHGKTTAKRGWLRKADEDIRYYEWLRLADRQGESEYRDPLEALIQSPDEPFWDRTCVRTKTRAVSKVSFTTPEEFYCRESKEESQGQGLV